MLLPLLCLFVFVCLCVCVCASRCACVLVPMSGFWRGQSQTRRPAATDDGQWHVRAYHMHTHTHTCAQRENKQTDAACCSPAATSFSFLSPLLRAPLIPKSFPLPSLAPSPLNAHSQRRQDRLVLLPVRRVSFSSLLPLRAPRSFTQPPPSSSCCRRPGSSSLRALPFTPHPTRNTTNNKQTTPNLTGTAPSAPARRTCPSPRASRRPATRSARAPASTRGRLKGVCVDGHGDRERESVGAEGAGCVYQGLGRVLSVL